MNKAGSYFIFDPSSGLYKIGIVKKAKNLKKRIRALKKKYHYGPQIEVLETKEDSLDNIMILEKSLHEKFKDKKCVRTMDVVHKIDGVIIESKLDDQKMNGGSEWFKLNNEDVEYTTNKYVEV